MTAKELAANTGKNARGERYVQGKLTKSGKPQSKIIYGKIDRILEKDRVYLLQKNGKRVSVKISTLEMIQAIHLIKDIYPHKCKFCKSSARKIGKLLFLCSNTYCHKSHAQISKSFPAPKTKKITKTTAC